MKTRVLYKRNPWPWFPNQSLISPPFEHSARARTVSQSSGTLRYRGRTLTASAKPGNRLTHPLVLLPLLAQWQANVTVEPRTVWPPLLLVVISLMRARQRLLAAPSHRLPFAGTMEFAAGQGDYMGKWREGGKYINGCFASCTFYYHLLLLLFLFLLYAGYLYLYSWETLCS